MGPVWQAFYFLLLTIIVWYPFGTLLQHVTLNTDARLWQSLRFTLSTGSANWTETD
jgi:hypothetical protein